MIEVSHPYQVVGFVLFLALVALVGNSASRREKEKNALEYFLGGRGIGAFAVGASLFVTTVASMWVVDSSFKAAGLGVWSGMFAALFVVVLGFLFAPMYIKAKVFTVPQFLSLRFDSNTALLWSAFSILFYVGVKIPLVITLATWSIEHALGWDFVPSVGLMVVVMLIGLYTIAGGYTSVLQTQVVQAAVVFAGSIVILLMLVIFPGPTTDPSSSGGIFSFELSISWQTLLLGLPIVLGWHWFADQYVLQRVLGARDIQTARKGSLLSASLILAEVAVIVAIGFLAPSLMDTTQHFPPTIITGIAGVAFVALIMASLASDFHSAATLFTMDFYRAAYPNARDESLVLIGRLSTTMIVILAILAVSAVSLVDQQLVEMLKQVEVHIAPPIVAVFLVGLFWTRMNGKGAMWALILGELFGVFHIALRYFKVESSLSLGVFALLSLTVSSFILVMVSFMTEAPSSESTTYMTILRRK